MHWLPEMRFDEGKPLAHIAVISPVTATREQLARSEKVLSRSNWRVADMRRESQCRCGLEENRPHHFRKFLGIQRETPLAEK
jgi:hypothetical protein